MYVLSYFDRFQAGFKFPVARNFPHPLAAGGMCHWVLNKYLIDDG